MVNDLPVRRFRAILASFLLLTASAALLAWIFVQVVTDRWLWTQYAFWAPALWVLAGITSLLVLRSGIVPRRKRDGSRRRAGVFSRGAWVTLIASWGWWLLFDQHALRPARQAPPDALRVLFWNVATSGGRDWAGSLPVQDADLVIIANPDRFDGIDDVLDRMPGAAPWISAFPFVAVS